jgi:hypothetical protein
MYIAVPLSKLIMHCQCVFVLEKNKCFKNSKKHCFQEICQWSGFEPMSRLISEQDGQIGRIRAFWAIVYFGQIFENLYKK